MVVANCVVGVGYAHVTHLKIQVAKLNVQEQNLKTVHNIIFYQHQKQMNIR